MIIGIRIKVFETTDKFYTRCVINKIVCECNATNDYKMEKRNCTRL